MRPLLLGLALTLAALGCDPTPDLPAPTDPQHCGGEADPQGSHNHVPEGTRVTYATNPPSSGDHWGCWAPWGVAKSVLPPERWVHNLEHGGIVLLYKCATADGCPALHDPLAKIAAEAPEAPTGGVRVLVTADPDLPSNVAAVSWGHHYLADSVDEGNLICFIRAHEGAGLEDEPSNPPQTSCPQVY